MQNDDMQAKFLREFAKIKGIEDEIKKINSGHKKLSKRIDQIEIQGLQEQINSLFDKLLETQRLVARFVILYTSNNIKAASQQLKLETLQVFLGQLNADTAHARTQVRTSSEPFVVADEFSRKAYADAEKQGIKFIDVH